MENTQRASRQFFNRCVSIILVAFFASYPLVGVNAASLQDRPSQGIPASATPLAGSAPNKFFMPVVVTRPAANTIFGAFLDAPTSDKGMSRMVAAGMGWAHFPFYWSSVEPTQGARNWGSVSRIDANLISATNNHIESILYINDTPGWALKSGYIGCGPVAQNKFSALVSFLTDFVTRYSAPPYNVKYYELWSEEDVYGLLGCWGDPSDPNYFGGGYYGEMLKVAYPAIKAANPQAQVLFGGLLMDCDPNHVQYCGGDPNMKRQIGSFLKGALEDGAGPYFDGISYHAYDYYWGLGIYSNPNWGSAWNTTGPVAQAKAAYLRGLLAQYNLTGKFLMNTEAALICGATGQEPACTTPDHTTTMGSYIAQSFASGIADGLRAKLWFSTAGWRGSGLLDSQLNPMPAYYAYMNVQKLLGQDSYVRTITDFPGVFGYEFINTETHQLNWVLWSVTTTGIPQTITFSSTPVAVYDMYGVALPVGTTIGVGLTPLFIVFSS
jgi:hypothetical protein